MPGQVSADLDFVVVVPKEDPLAGLIVDRLVLLIPGWVRTTFDSLSSAAMHKQDAVVLLVASDPVEAVAQQLEAAVDATEALALWKDMVRPLVQDARRIRRRLWFVDARALVSGDAELLVLFPRNQIQAGLDAGPAVPGPVCLLMAEALLDHDDEAKRLASELAVLRRGPVGQKVSQQTSIAAAAQYAGLVALNSGRGAITGPSSSLEDTGGKPHIGNHVARLAAVEKERDLLRENVKLQLEASNQAAAEREKMEAELAHLRGAAADRHLQKALTEALERRLVDAQRDAALREAALAYVLLDDQKALVSDRGAEDRKRADHLEQELHKVYASRSWRVTRPLRGFRSLGRS